MRIVLYNRSRNQSRNPNELKSYNIPSSLETSNGLVKSKLLFQFISQLVEAVRYESEPNLLPSASIIEVGDE